MKNIEAVVKVSDLMDHLKRENLVIVHKSVIDDSELELLRMQKASLKKDALTLSEIIKGQLLHPHLTTTHSIRAYKGFKPGEKFNANNGNGVLMICTSAIKRLRKTYGYADL